MKLKMLLATLAMVPIAAFAADNYYTNTFASIYAKPGADYLGKIPVATEVQVLKTDGDKSLVKVTGWALKEYPSQIFQAPGLRIELGSFDEEEVVKLDPAAGTKEVQGNEWDAASAEGWVETKDLTTDIDKLWAQAKAREQEVCSGCHAAPEPDHFNANQWASQLPLKGGRAGHTRAGKNELVFRWLQQFAKPL